MENSIFDYTINGKILAFENTLVSSNPFISLKPRNHESIFLVTKGTLLYEKENTKTIVKKGEIGYVARGSIDKTSAYQCEAVTFIKLNFNFDDVDVSSTLPFNTMCSSGLAYNYETLFNEISKNYALKIPGYQVVCKGLILQIIGCLYSEFVNEGVLLKKMQKINDALEYLRKNYLNQDLTIAHLAKISNMSERSFRRIFVDVYKKTPYDFLLNLRISEGKKLLLNTDNKLTDIALQCGFADLYSFSHSFKAHTGYTPTEYRNS